MPITIGSTAGQTYNDGLVAHYPLNEGVGRIAQDVVGGNHGSFVGTPTWTTGQTGNAVLCGPSAAITTASLAALRSSTFTMSAWMKRNSATNQTVNMGQGSVGNASMELWSDGIFYCEIGSNWGQVTCAGTTWRHCIAIYDGSQSGNSNRLKVYIDGVAQVLSFVGTIPATSPADAGTFDIGRYLGSSYSSGGVFDDVRVYNRALSDSEAIALYNSYTARPSISSNRVAGSTSNGLVAHYNFSEGSGSTTKNAAGGNNTGTLNSSPTWTGGISGPALQFSGSNYVSVPYDAALSPSTFTISCWAKASAAGAGSYRSPFSNRGLFKGFLFYQTAGSVWEFWTGAGGSWNTTLVGPSVNFDRWEHLVGTYDGTMRFYVNGVAVGTPATVTFSPTPSELRIGAGQNEDVPNFFFMGAVDDARIYNRVLSATEVANLYAEPFRENGLIGYWKLDEPTGSVALDASGNSNNGTLVASPTRVTGIHGNALTLNGTTQYVNCGNATSLQLSNGSFSVWFKIAALDTPNNIVRALICKQSAYGLFLYDNNVRLYDWGAGAWRGAAAAISDTNWHHAALVFQSGIVNGTTIYVDGVAVQTTTMTVQSQGANANLGFGGAANQYFNGTLDEARIYNRLLTAKEVLNLYQRNFP